MPAPRIWRCGPHTLSLSRPLVMGILNVTPDSFSDGGRFLSADTAIEHGRSMLAEGADVIDVGGESTRPGSDEVAPAEESRRVLPVIGALAGGAAPISVDTRHADVARAAVAGGAAIVNDVAGFRDQEMVDLAAGSDFGLVVMHMLGEPQTMQAEPRYDDVVAEVATYLRERIEALASAGVARDRIAVDPGIGFGKTLEHNMEILRHLHTFAALGCPLVVGASRKRFIGALTGVESAVDRVAGSVAAAAWAVEHGAGVVRVHDVAETVQALRVTAALAGQDHSA